MAYLVLARKYRPQTFEDVVGQEEIGNTLRRSIEADRVAHAYLFCGPRGVGKTSLARIFSKALNCPNVKDAVPCGTCPICEDIAGGADVDVLEIDGASNRGIDEVRGIRESAKFMPARGRFKIYIIDEVHMLTGPAFNALLKTLEEPPPHVIFLFATTHPQALPDTVRSRCQRFDFRAIERGDIVKRLEQICDAEKVTAEPEALGLIADLAEGGMRDAQSLLDQMIAYGQGDVRRLDVEKMLGLPSTSLCVSLIEAMAAGEAGRALEIAEDAIRTGTTPEDLADRLQRLARDLLIVASVPDSKDVPLLSGTPIELLSARSDLLPADAFSYLVKLFSEALNGMRNPGPSRIHLELAVIRGARLVDYLPLDAVVAALRGGGETSAPRTGDARRSAGSAATPRTSSERAAPNPSSPRPAPSATAATTPPARPREPRPTPPPTDGGAKAESAAAPGPGTVPVGGGSWDDAVSAVKAAKPGLGSFLSQARVSDISGSVIEVLLPERNRFGRERLEENRKSLQALVSSALGRAVELRFKLGAVGNERSIEETRRNPAVFEEGVRRVKDIFDGREVPPGESGGSLPLPDPYSDESGA